MSITLYNQKEIQKMRDAGKLTAETFALLGEHVRPGVTSKELDRIAEQYIRKHGAVPAYKGYRPRFAQRPFPATICVATNDAICHGFPSEAPLKEGDIVGIDIGLQLNGFYGDACVTYAVGTLAPEAARLMQVAEEALYRGINVVRPNRRTGDIGAAIQTYVEANKFSVVREWSGHGVGRKLHEDLNIPHYGKANTGQKLLSGMIFTIEPMVNAGSPENYVDKRDGWTVRTKDGSLSAQFEHSVVVTDQGVEILTKL